MGRSRGSISSDSHPGIVSTVNAYTAGTTRKVTHRNTDPQRAFFTSTPCANSPFLAHPLSNLRAVARPSHTVTTVNMGIFHTLYRPHASLQTTYDPSNWQTCPHGGFQRFCRRLSRFDSGFLRPCFPPIDIWGDQRAPYRRMYTRGSARRLLVVVVEEYVDDLVRSWSLMRRR